MDTKLIVSASPHLRSEETTQSLMANVIVALCPCVVASAIIFGARALLVTAVSVVACVAFEWLYCKLLKKANPISDLSAVVTGIILAMNVNVNRARAQVQLSQGTNQLEGVRGVQGRTIDVGYEIVQLQQLNDRLVDQAAAVNAQHHAVLAVQLTDEGDQLLCGSLTVNPGSGCSRHV